jgi:hypothetical protein
MGLWVGFTALGGRPLAYTCAKVKAPLVCRRGRANQRRHRYLENRELESIGGGGAGRRGKNEGDYKKGQGVCHAVALHLH